MAALRIAFSRLVREDGTRRIGGSPALRRGFQAGEKEPTGGTTNRDLSLPSCSMKRIDPLKAARVAQAEKGGGSEVHNRPHTEPARQWGRACRQRADARNQPLTHAARQGPRHKACCTSPFGRPIATGEP